MTPEEEAEIRRRQKARNLALALVLLFFVALFYVITLVKTHG
ncbi:hypothetical protein [Qipengyuania algicida]|nr:hypothetical protein [Qipengyuania algicida]